MRHEELNSICWTIFENYKTFNDLEALKTIKTWSASTYKALPDNSEICDTYGHILYESGDIKEAIKLEEKAFKISSEKKGQFPKFYGEEVEKFNKNLK